MSKVSLIKTDNYSQIKSDIKACVNLLGGFNKYIKKGDKVLLKPNLFGIDSPEHSATNLKFVFAVADLVKEAGGIPAIGELIASDKPGLNRLTFKKRGVIDLAIKHKVKLVDFQTSKLRRTNIENPLVLPHVDVVEPMFTYDVIINLPKLKGHPGTYITAGVKNCFGCIRDTQRGEIHRDYQGEDFAKAVVDTHTAMKFHLTIVDAVIGMDTNEAPAYGPERKIGYVVAGEDCISIDAVAGRITGHEIKYLPTVKYAHLAGKGVGRLKEITILGNSPEIVEFEKHTNYDEYVERMKESKETETPIDNQKLGTYPHIVQPDCIICNSCVYNCPADAIHMKDGGLIIDESKCVKCYRCLEACPTAAVQVKKD